MPPRGPNELYQYSLLSALMAGVANSGIPASALSGYSQGLGTFANIDGELILLDGKGYQLKSDGSVYQVEPGDQIPFVMATNLSADKTFRSSLPDKDSLHQKLGETFPGCKNLFIAYRVKNIGKGWKRLKVRTVGGQQYRGQPLSELGEAQRVFNYEDIQGEIVGFSSPLNWQGVSVAGEHMHFLSSDRKYGGHVLEMEVEEVEIQASIVNNLHIDLPKSKEFNEARLVVDDTGIKKVEG